MICARPCQVKAELFPVIHPLFTTGSLPARRLARPKELVLGDASVTAAGRARLSSARRSRNQTARSVWSAWSLLPLSNRATHRTAGASSTHSIRFARHDRPPCSARAICPVFPGKSAQENNNFGYSNPARRAVVLLGAAIDAPIIFLSSAWHN